MIKIKKKNPSHSWVLGKEIKKGCLNCLKYQKLIEAAHYKSKINKLF